MKFENWKTTLGGIIGAAGLALTASPNQTVHLIGVGIAAAATAWFGWHASDK